MKRLFALIIFLVSFFAFIKPVDAFTELDRIEKYEITVDPLTDGTLNLNYHIEWRVLDSTSEGSLTWVKIGVPNRFISNINYSGAVKKAYYESDDGAFMHCDLNREYNAGEVVNINFSFHQERIFTNNGDTVEFAFRPGWFDEIKVESITVYWSKAINSIYTNATSENDDYYIWQDSLNYGETISCQMKYTLDSFPQIDLKKGYSNQSTNPVFIILVIGGIALAVILIFILAAKIDKANSDGYEYYRGYTGDTYFRNYWFYRHIHHYGGYDRSGQRFTSPVVKNVKSGGHSGGHSGGGGCACACACAGGGRAGCSRKDFYHPNVKISDVEKALKNK